MVWPARYSLIARQAEPTPTCVGGSLGRGVCVAPNTCPGITYRNQCQGTTECCFIRHCEVRQGSGFCLDRATQNCTQGAFIQGTGRPWPCPGDANIVCCVKYADMVNGTSGSTTAPSTTRSTSASSLSTGASSLSTGDGSLPTGASGLPAPGSTTEAPSHPGLTGSQIGGIVGGAVGAVVLLVLAFLIQLFRRKKKRAGATATADETATADGTEGADSHMIDGSPIKEMDASSPKQEDGNSQMIDSSPIMEMDASDTKKKPVFPEATVFHELSGSLDK